MGVLTNLWYYLTVIAPQALRVCRLGSEVLLPPPTLCRRPNERHTVVTVRWWGGSPIWILIWWTFLFNITLTLFFYDQIRLYKKSEIIWVMEKTITGVVLCGTRSYWSLDLWSEFWKFIPGNYHYIHFHILVFLWRRNILVKGRKAFQWWTPSQANQITGNAKSSRSVIKCLSGNGFTVARFYLLLSWFLSYHKN